MTKKIPSKIKSYRLVTETDSPKAPLVAKLPDRGYMLDGKTYKVKTPDSEAAYYFTINNKVVGDKVQPWEIFCNSRDVTHFQWVTALTRSISAIFRLSAEPQFIIDELISVIDPKGGFFEGGRYIPSLAAKIGYIIKEHLAGLATEVAPATEEPKAEAPERKSNIQCTNPVCLQFSVVIRDGCKMCLDCGSSSCG